MSRFQATNRFGALNAENPGQGVNPAKNQLTQPKSAFKDLTNNAKPFGSKENGQNNGSGSSSMKKDFKTFIDSTSKFPDPADFGGVFSPLMEEKELEFIWAEKNLPSDDFLTISFRDTLDFEHLKEDEYPLSDLEKLPLSPIPEIEVPFLDEFTSPEFLMPLESLHIDSFEFDFETDGDFHDSLDDSR